MAISHYYVDPASGDDTTGNGTIGTPWKSVQKALNTITRNATDGDQINVKAGAADVLTAGLLLTTYGTPDSAAPLIIRGYSSMANDGGIGEIDGAGSYFVYSAGANANKSSVHFWDMKLGNSGASQIIRLQAYSSLVNCEVHTSTANQAVYFHNVSNRVVNCLFHTLSGLNNVYVASASTFFIGCTFRSAGGTYVLNLTGVACAAINCWFDISTDTSLVAIYSASDPIILNCTIYSGVAQTVSAVQIEPGASTSLALVLNTLIAGYGGVGGKGYAAGGNLTAAGGNAYYGNTTGETVASKVSYPLQAAVALGGGPFVNADNDDFNIVAGSEALGAAWPQVAKGMAATTSAGDIGAAQAAAGGGVIRRVARVMGG